MILDISRIAQAKVSTQIPPKKPVFRMAEKRVRRVSLQFLRVFLKAPPRCHAQSKMSGV